MVAKIYSCFPGTGKSYFYNNKTNAEVVLDSDSSTFDKKYFPENYIKHIKDNLNKADIIFVSSHEDVRNAMVEANIDFVLVYPDISLREEYLERYRKRNNNEKFINLIKNNWDMWLKNMMHNPKTKDHLHIILKSGKFISDIIKHKKEVKVESSITKEEKSNETKNNVAENKEAPKKSKKQQKFASKHVVKENNSKEE